MNLQVVKEGYKDWRENHPASEVAFEFRQEADCKSEFIEMDIAAAKNLKDWDIDNINSLKVYNTLLHSHHFEVLCSTK